MKQNKYNTLNKYIYIILNNTTDMKKNLLSTFSKSILLLVVILMQLLTFASNSAKIHSNFYIDKNLKNAQILANAVMQQNDANEFDLFSHGKPGQLYINNQWLNVQQIVAFIQPKLTKNITQLNIYGCEFAKGVVEKNK